jgi:hypothetical protein
MLPLVWIPAFSGLTVLGECAPLHPRHPGARSGAEPAGTQASRNGTSVAAWTSVGDADAMFFVLIVDWVPAFAGMTFGGCAPIFSLREGNYRT